VILGDEASPGRPEQGAARQDETPECETEEQQES
jgi:hypothetical protein